MEVFKEESKIVALGAATAQVGAKPSAEVQAGLLNLRRRVTGADSPQATTATIATPRRETNRELLHRARNGKTDRERSDAAEALRRQIKSLCAAVIDRHTAHLTASEAEDLTQDVLVRLLQCQGGETAASLPDPTPAYIARVAVNLLIDQRRFLRRRGLEKAAVSVEESGDALTIRDTAPSVESEVIGRIADRDLRALLARALSPAEAAVLWRRSEGASHQEIAEEMGINEANARKRCERGLKRLRQLADTGAFATA